MAQRPRIAALARTFPAAAVVALWLALIAGMLGRYSWLLDLLAHFRVQYAVLFGLFTVLLLASRRWMLAGFGGLGALLCTAFVLAQIITPESRAAGLQPLLRVVTSNVWYRNGDFERIGRVLENTAADVIVLQELSRPRALQLQPYLHSYPHSFIDPGQQGVVVFSRWPILAAKRVALSPGADAARVSIDWRGTVVSVIGVHLHWPIGSGDSRLRNEEMRVIAAMARSSDQPLIVAGDLNVTVWSAHFRDLLQASRLSDCAAGVGLSPSWPAQFPPAGIRIDHCLASAHWRAMQARIGPAVGSDHFPVIADLQLSVTRGGAAAR